MNDHFADAEVFIWGSHMIRIAQLIGTGALSFINENIFFFFFLFGFFYITFTDKKQCAISLVTFEWYV